MSSVKDFSPKEGQGLPIRHPGHYSRHTLSQGRIRYRGSKRAMYVAYQTVVRNSSPHLQAMPDTHRSGGWLCRLYQSGVMSVSWVGYRVYAPLSKEMPVVSAAIRGEHGVRAPGRFRGAHKAAVCIRPGLISCGGGCFQEAGMPRSCSRRLPPTPLRTGPVWFLYALHFSSQRMCFRQPQ